MRILRDWRNVPAACRGAAYAIGNFDGVHRGHQAVIARAAEAAAALGAPLGVLTFEPHPRSIFQPGAPPFRLTPFRSKARLLHELGVETLAALRFNPRLYEKPADRFIADVLVAGLGARHVTVGYDFVFGFRRTGNVELLVSLGQRHGFGVTVVEPVTQGEDIYSSTVIRLDLESGRPRRAAELLGHWWEVAGRVRHGDARGRQIGFRTANLHLKPGALRPALGVYAVHVGLDDGAGWRWLKGVANLGRRPTFDGQGVILEVHLFDFAADIYGRPMRVAFVERLRGEKKFPGLDALKAQIAADAEHARAVLADPRNARERLVLSPIA
jgi:riboflavin kinase/FMN adenylyltransferase